MPALVSMLLKYALNAALLGIPEVIKAAREGKAKDAAIKVMVDAIDKGSKGRMESNIQGTVKNLVHQGLNAASDKAEEEINRRARKYIERYL